MLQLVSDRPKVTVHGSDKPTAQSPAKPSNSVERYRVLFALIGLLCACAIFASNASAEKTHTADDFYQSQLKVTRDENWLRRELREFQTFPHLDKAYQLMAVGETKEAIAEINQYLNIDPEDARVRMMLIVLLYQGGANSDAIREAGLILKYHPSFVPALLYRGLASAAMRRDQEAIEDFKRIFRSDRALQQDRSLATKTLADLFMRNKRYLEALTPLEALSKISKEYRVFIQMGLAYEGLGLKSDAVQTYRKALALARGATQKIEAYAYLSEATRKARDPAATELILKEAITYFPKYRPFLIALAHITYTQKRYDDAIAWIERALVIRDTREERNFLITLREMTSATPPLKTTEEIEKVLSRAKNSEEVYTLSMMLGYAYMRRNSSKQALRAFESAAQIKKQDAAALEGIVEASSQSGDYTTAVATQRRIAALRSTAQSRLKLGILLFEAKGYGEAATVFRKTIDELKDDGDFLAAVHYQAAILEKQSNIPDAIDVLGKAYKRYPMENSLALYIANLSNKLASCDATLQCISRFTWDMTNKKIAQNLAAIYERCESTDRAANVYKKLLQNAPNDEGARRTYLVRIGNLSFAQKKYAEAADYYLSALAEGTYIVPAGGIGHRVEGEKNPSPSERAELYDRLGNCRAMEKKYSYAARSWLAAYSLVPRSHYILQAMSASALAGDLIEASRLENKVRLSELSQEEKLRFWDQMAAIYWQKGDAERAADLYLKAYEIAPSARRQFALGHCYIQMGESERGVAAFKRAAAMDRGNIDYEVALARAESMAGNWNDAAKRFVKIIAKHPEMKDLYVDTAYAHLHMPNNDRAVMWLKRAIDVRNEELRTSYDDDLYREIYRLRQEVSTIDNIFDLDAYYTFTTDRRQWSSHTGGIERGAVPSLGGLRIALQPPTIGYRDGRIFQIYARLMWNTEPRTLKPNPKTLQGGAGVSYKPLRVVDWNFAIEDLFMLGASAQNNLLLYSGISWGIGTNLRPMKKVWNYTAIFSDVAFWAVKNRTFSAYGEYRQGATFNIADLILITPLLIGDTRYQVNKLGYNLYFEGGPGISIKGFLYRTNYMVELMNLELLVQYKWGTLIENTQGAENHAFRGLYVTMRYML